MKNIAVITARSGSKALVDKNIKLLAGKPLLAYTIEAAKESGCFTGAGTIGSRWAVPLPSGSRVGS